MEDCVVGRVLGTCRQGGCPHPPSKRFNGAILPACIPKVACRRTSHTCGQIHALTHILNRAMS